MLSKNYGLVKSLMVTAEGAGGLKVDKTCIEALKKTIQTFGHEGARYFNGLLHELYPCGLLYLSD